MTQKFLLILFFFSSATCFAESKDLPDTTGATILTTTIHLSKDTRMEFFYDHKLKGNVLLCRVATKRFYKNEMESIAKIPRNYSHCDGENSPAWVVTPSSINPKSDGVLRMLVGQRIRMAPEAMKPIEPNVPYDLRMTYLTYPKGSEPSRFFLETAADSDKFTVRAVNWKKIKIEDAETQFGYDDPAKSDPKKNANYTQQYVPN